MKIERLLALTVMLLNRKRVAAKELADYFGVTIRTIYRDIDTLNASGIPVISYQGFEGGFCIADNYKLTRQLLTFDDIVSLLTLLKGVNRTLKNREVDQIIEKITALIPSDKEEEYERGNNSFILDISPWGANVPTEHLLADLHRAITFSHRISFTYISGSGVVTSRTVEPYTLVLKSFTWYVIAFCTLRKEFRLFKVIRMKDCTVQEERFVRQPFNPHDLFSSGVDSRVSVTLRLKFSQEVAYKVEEMFPSTVIKKEPDSLIVEMTMPFDEWVIGMILSFGSDVTIVEPAELRDVVYQKIVAMQQNYQ